MRRSHEVPFSFDYSLVLVTTFTKQAQQGITNAYLDTFYSPPNVTPRAGWRKT